MKAWFKQTLVKWELECFDAEVWEKNMLNWSHGAPFWLEKVLYISISTEYNNWLMFW